MSLISYALSEDILLGVGSEVYFYKYGVREPNLVGRWGVFVGRRRWDLNILR